MGIFRKALDIILLQYMGTSPLYGPIYLIYPTKTLHISMYVQGKILNLILFSRCHKHMNLISLMVMSYFNYAHGTL